jgi:hypothetical protein
MKQLSFILLLMTLSTSCKKEVIITDNDHLTFGSFYGECLGADCVKFID